MSKKSMANNKQYKRASSSSHRKSFTVMPFVKVHPVDKTTNSNMNDDGVTVVETGEAFESKNEEKQIIKTAEKGAGMLTLWEEFRESTSLHALKHVQKEKLYQWRWIIWIVQLLGMVALLVYNVSSLYIFYKTYPTITNTNVQFVKEMSYPAITICNLSPAKKSVVNATPAFTAYLLHHDSRLGILLPPVNYSDPAYAELNQLFPENVLSETGFDINDIFVICINKRTVISCTNILSRTITQRGACFTYNNNNTVGEMKMSTTGSEAALTFYIDIKKEEYIYNTNMAAGVKIVLHEQDEEPDVINKGFILSPRKSAYVSIKMTKYKYLPAPYKMSGDQYCIDTKAPEYKNPLKYYPAYSHTACISECRRNYIVAKCGCRSLTDRGNETLCSPASLAACYYDIVEFENSANLKEQCKCLISCEFTTFDQSISTAAFPATVYTTPLHSMGFDNFKENGIEVRLYYDSLSYLYVESIPEYTTEHIVGILGGEIGLFIGASLLTLSELLEFIILELVLVVKRCFSFMCTKRDLKNKQASV